MGIGVTASLVAAVCLAGPRPSVAEEAAGLEQIGRLAAPEIDESSGLVRSRNDPARWWTHNDSGGDPVLYAVTKTGESLGSVLLMRAHNFDWEDLAAGADGRLWVGDMGDNLRFRSRIVLYVLPEPDPEKTAVAHPKTYRLTYPDGPHDAEALVVQRDMPYVFTKVPRGELTTVYTADLTRPRPFGGLGEDDTIPMHAVARLKLDLPLTGADLSAEGTRLALTGCKGVYVFIGRGELTELLTKAPHYVPLKNARQVEAVGFEGHDLLFTNEQRTVFRLRAAAYEAADTVVVAPAAQ